MAAPLHNTLLVRGRCIRVPAAETSTHLDSASTSHYRAAASLLDWSEIPQPSGAKQRGRRQPLSASSSCECRPDKHTVCIRLAQISSRKLARVVDVSRRLV